MVVLCVSQLRLEVFTFVYDSTCLLCQRLAINVVVRSNDTSTKDIMSTVGLKLLEIADIAGRMTM